LLAAEFWQKKTQASRSKHSQSTTLQCFFVFCFYQSCNLKQSKADSLACCRTELSIKNRLLWVIWKKEPKDCHSLSDMNARDLRVSRWMDPLSLHMRMMCSYVTMEYQLVGLQKKYMDKYFDDSASNISFFFEGKENETVLQCCPFLCE
jgi:hypothetical protein